MFDIKFITQTRNVSLKNQDISEQDALEIFKSILNEKEKIKTFSISESDINAFDKGYQDALYNDINEIQKNNPYQLDTYEYKLYIVGVLYYKSTN